MRLKRSLNHFWFIHLIFHFNLEWIWNRKKGKVISVLLPRRSLPLERGAAEDENRLGAINNRMKCDTHTFFPLFLFAWNLSAKSFDTEHTHMQSDCVQAAAGRLAGQNGTSSWPHRSPFNAFQTAGQLLPPPPPQAQSRRRHTFNTFRVEGKTGRFRAAATWQDGRPHATTHVIDCTRKCANWRSQLTKKFKWKKRKEKESDSKNIYRFCRHLFGRNVLFFLSFLGCVGAAQIGSYRQPNKKKIKRQQRPNGLSLSRSLLCNDPLCGIIKMGRVDSVSCRGRSDTNRSYTHTQEP